MHFGEHLMIDGYGGSFELLNNKGLVMQALQELPKKLGMKILTKPRVLYGPPNDKKDPGGWTGFVIIAESHISIHTFSSRGFLTADIYSCKNGMDVKYIKTYFTKAFQLKDLEINFVKRGTRYPSKNLQ